ncbi:C-type lectin domain family 4 member D-like [Esox lucius]|uniref:C-type lectin domain-containing protein n=1 Tax=Esox lucius TaxID=8010 RepID=A0A3P8YWW0_ESOLU|nr:C-type lectin domain family 4 member D-like [Esox lucius]
MENHQVSQGLRKWVGLLRVHTIFLMLIGLLLSIGTNQAAAQPQVNTTHPKISPETELASLKLELNSVRYRFRLLCRDHASLAKNCSDTVVNCTECPVGWIHIDEQCYFFRTDKMNWTNSKDNCTAMGSRLTILQGKEQNALMNEFKRESGFGNQYFWIGLSDIAEEGHWRWVDHTEPTETFWDKWSSQPDNYKSGGDEGEDCVVLNPNTQTWHDVPCDFEYPHICQKDATQIIL